MKQKHEILIAIGIADDVDNPRDIDLFCSHLSAYAGKLLGEEDLLYLENLEEEWGEPV